MIRSWLRGNAHPRFWLSYRPWKGILTILIALVVALRNGGGEAQAWAWLAVLFLTVFWSQTYDHERYMDAKAGCVPTHAWIPADAISKQLQPNATETCPRCGDWR